LLRSEIPAACAQSFAPEQQTTTEIMRRNLSYSLYSLIRNLSTLLLLLARATNIFLFFASQSLYSLIIACSRHEYIYNLSILLLLLARATNIYFCSSRSSRSW